ncbi:MAG: hypothetical protein ACRDGE_01550 [Candidatus Limnocylindria bacterium]
MAGGVIEGAGAPSPRWRRQLGTALLVYGIAGVVLLGAAAALGWPSLGRALSFADSSSAAVSEAAAAVGAAAGSFDGIEVSLADAERAARSAAASSRASADTSRRLSDAMSISIFGARPLEPIANDFATQAQLLDDLAHDLDGLAFSLERNQHDAATIGLSLERLHARLDQAAPVRVAGAQVGYGDATRLVVAALVLWLLAPALAAIAVGTILRRSAGISRA